MATGASPAYGQEDHKGALPGDPRGADKEWMP